MNAWLWFVLGLVVLTVPDFQSHARYFLPLETLNPRLLPDGKALTQYKTLLLVQFLALLALRPSILLLGVRLWGSGLTCKPSERPDPKP